MFSIVHSQFNSTNDKETKIKDTYVPVPLTESWAIVVVVFLELVARMVSRKYEFIGPGSRWLNSRKNRKSNAPSRCFFFSWWKASWERQSIWYFRKSGVSVYAKEHTSHIEDRSNNTLDRPQRTVNENEKRGWKWKIK